MKLKLQDKTVFIADDSVSAQKIREGYDYTVTDKDGLVIGKMGTKITNLHQARLAVGKATGIPDLKVILLKLLDVMEYN